LTPIDAAVPNGVLTLLGRFAIDTCRVKPPPHCIRRLDRRALSATRSPWLMDRRQGFSIRGLMALASRRAAASLGLWAAMACRAIALLASRVHALPKIIAAALLGVL